MGILLNEIFRGTDAILALNPMQKRRVQLSYADIDIHFVKNVQVGWRAQSIEVTSRKRVSGGEVELAI